MELDLHPTASPLPAAAATATAATVATVATRTVFTRLCLVHAEITSAVVLVVESLNCIQRLFTIRHFHEAEAPGLTGHLVQDDARRRHDSVRLELSTQLPIRNAVRKITDEYVHTTSTNYTRSHVSTNCTRRACDLQLSA